jgi:hypothetical protein
MDFNWPDIPFTGPEVEAFVDAYKELAEYIYDEFENYVSPLEIKSPYTNKKVIKELLQAGLVYSSFIIQQRSGSSGPGTDFNLNNSPHQPPLTGEQKAWVLKNIGCVFDPDAMKAAWNDNGIPGSPPPLGDADDPLGNPANDGWGDGNGDPNNGGASGSGGNGQGKNGECPPGSECNGGCPEGKICRNCRCVNEDCPQNPCGLTIKESLLLGAYNTLGFGSLRNAKADLTTRYLTCNASQFTENDLSSGQLNQIKTEGERILKREIRFCGRGCTIQLVELTGFLTSIQRTLWGMQEGDRAIQADTYTPNFGSSTLFGTLIYITDSTGTVVKGIRDDFDFAYGYERGGRWSRINTGSNSMPGTVPLPAKVSGSKYNNCTVDDLLNNFGKGGSCDVTDSDWMSNVGRKVIIEAYRCNRGTPVPIYINFN